MGGRPPALSAVQREEAKHMRDVENRSLAEIARIFKVDYKTIKRLK